MTQNILIFLRNLNSNQLMTLGEGCVRVREWMQRVTGGAVRLDFSHTTAPRDKYDVFVNPSAGGIGYTVRNYTHLNPVQVMQDAAKYGVEVGKAYQAVYIAYNVAREEQVPGSAHGTMAFPMELSGLRCVNFVMTETADVFTTAQVLAHELMHLWYDEANEHGANLIDDVHAHAGIDSPIGNYSLIVQKLSAYWPFITAPMPTPTIPLPYHHFAHLQNLRVRVGDSVVKGKQVAECGPYPAGSHCHYEVMKKRFTKPTQYVRGMSLEQVKALYQDPMPFVCEGVPVPLERYGYRYLDRTSDGVYHPGVDLNFGPTPNFEIGKPVLSTVTGRVVYVGNDPGWGYHVWIEQTK